MTSFQQSNKKAAKLTPQTVQDIRALYAEGGISQGQLARDYRVSVVQIGRIVRGEVWQSLPALAPSAREIEESQKRLLARLRGDPPPEGEGIARLAAEAAELMKADVMINEIKRSPLDE